MGLTSKQAILAVAVISLCNSCDRGGGGEGEEFLYSARLSVAVRAALAPDSATSAHLQLHDRVRVLRRRRSLVLVRTDSGEEGWVRERELVAENDWLHARRLAAFVDSFPGQGVRRAFDALNVHIHPARGAVTIYQLTPEEPVELLRSHLASRPADSQPTSRRRPETWHLVRTRVGPVGWVLASRLYADMPVEVAQYAEGRRILAFFRLDDLPHPTWIWTQSGSGPYDYDRFRVFRWNEARSAYQTVGLRKGLRGRLPIEVHDWVESDQGSGPGFSLRLVGGEDEEVSRTYLLSKGRVHRVSERQVAPAVRIPDSFEESAQTVETSNSWADQWKEWIGDLF